MQEGVQFQSPHDDSKMLLTPEESIRIQNTIGADIIMQLDDVVHVLTTGPRVEEAMWRSVRWLDRSVQCWCKWYTPLVSGCTVQYVCINEMNCNVYDMV